MANETNVPHAKPTTLDGWVKLLDSVPLPVPQEAHHKVCRAIRDNRSSLRDIADLMQDSPALALSIIREANRHTHGNMATPAENLEVAINRLGLARTEELLARLPAVAQMQIPKALGICRCGCAGRRASNSSVRARPRRLIATSRFSAGAAMVPWV